MARFFLHIYNGAGLTEDDDGQELAGLDEARASAVAGIRSLLAEELLSGTIDLRGRIEIFGEDDQEPLEIVHFRDVVTVQLDEPGT